MGGGKNFVAVARDRGFVGRDHVLALRNGLQHERSRRLQPAHELDDGINGGIGNDPFQIVGQDIGGQLDAARLIRRAHPDALDLELAQQWMAPLGGFQDPDNATADRAQAQQAEFECQAYALVPSAGIVLPSPQAVAWLTRQARDAARGLLASAGGPARAGGAAPRTGSDRAREPRR